MKPSWWACFPDHCPSSSPSVCFRQVSSLQRSLPRKRSLPFLTGCQIAHPGYIVTKHVVAWLPWEETSLMSTSIIVPALWCCSLWGKWRIFYLWARKGGLWPKGYSGMWREEQSLVVRWWHPLKANVENLKRKNGRHICPPPGDDCRQL